MVLSWMATSPVPGYQIYSGRLQPDAPHSQPPLPTHGLRWCLRCFEAATWRCGLPVPDTQQSSETVPSLANPVSTHIRRCPVLPSASPLQGAHHFPRWRPEEHFGAGNIGASLHADWAADCHGARRGIDRDWYAALAALAAHDLDVIPFGGWHISAMPRLSRPAAGNR